MAARGEAAGAAGAAVAVAAANLPVAELAATCSASLTTSKPTSEGAPLETVVAETRMYLFPLRLCFVVLRVKKEAKSLIELSLNPSRQG